VVETCVTETSLAALVRHELRWLRTIRAVRPLGFGFSFVTFGMPVAALGALLACGSPPAVGMFAVTTAARIMLHLRARVPPCSERQMLALLAARDLLSFGLWAWSFATRRVHWRDLHYLVSRDGSARLVAGYERARTVGDET